jgi:hypothetical protein
MTHQMMVIWFWGGVVLAAPPVLMILGVVAYVWHRHRNEKRELLRESTDKTRT